MYYKDLRDYLKALEENGMLIKITNPINKDTELHPLVRLQYRGLPEEERKAFLFENIYDCQDRRYSIPVVVGAMAASSHIYAIGLKRKVEEIPQTWIEAQVNPIEPVLVPSGPVQEVVHRGEELTKEGGGLEMFPIPISTPGFDNAPYITSGHWVTKDPETGKRNLGNYRGQVKSRNRLGCWAGRPQDISNHWRMCKERGVPLEAAVVIGVTPNVSYVAVSKVPYEQDELAVAGGLAGEPLELVKCKTVDLEVPANAEIVIEGEIPTDVVEPEGAFGEFTGYMGRRTITMFLNITCITHRRDPIYQAIISQFPPSESRKLVHIGSEAVMLKYLKVDCGLAGVQEVAMHEECAVWGYTVIQIKKKKPGDGDSKLVLDALENMDRFNGKMAIVVDEDINPKDPDAVNWALSFRMQPHRDVRITKVKGLHLDPSVMHPAELEKVTGPLRQLEGSSLLIDATRKWPFPPVSLPKKEFMVRALELWEKEGLPELKLKEPWYGYSLGYWTEEEEEEAVLALQGKHYLTGERQASRKKKS